MTRARELSRLVTPTNFTVDAANARVGVGSTTPASKLDVEGTLTADVVSVGGSVTAATFFGDGEGLTNVGFDTSQISANSISVTGVVTATTFSGNATSATNAQGLTGTPNIVVGLATVGTALSLADNVKARFGTGGDLEIFHDGSNSFIKDVGTGILQLNTNYFQVKNAADDEFLIQASQNGAVSLRFDNSEKFTTTNTGAVVTGILTATSFEGSGENLTNLPASGDANDITACLFI
jgi:hypothetical protein